MEVLAFQLTLSCHIWSYIRLCSLFFRPESLLHFLLHDPVLCSCLSCLSLCSPWPLTLGTSLTASTCSTAGLRTGPPRCSGSPGSTLRMHSSRASSRWATTHACSHGFTYLGQARPCPDSMSLLNIRSSPASMPLFTLLLLLIEACITHASRLIHLLHSLAL